MRTLGTSQVNEGECLQSIQSEPAWAVQDAGLLVPLPPIGTQARLARRNAKPFFGGSLCHIEISLISMNLIEAKIDRQLFWSSILCLAKQPVGEIAVVAIGSNALLEQNIDRIWDVAEIDEVGF